MSHKNKHKYKLDSRGMFSSNSSNRSQTYNQTSMYFVVNIMTNAYLFLFLIFPTVSPPRLSEILFYGCYSMTASPSLLHRSSIPVTFLSSKQRCFQVIFFRLSEIFLTFMYRLPSINSLSTFLWVPIAYNKKSSYSPKSIIISIHILQVLSMV